MRHTSRLAPALLLVLGAAALAACNSGRGYQQAQPAPAQPNAAPPAYTAPVMPAPPAPSGGSACGAGGKACGK